MLHTDNSISSLDKLNDVALQQDGLLEKGLNLKRQAECGVSQQPVNSYLCENKDGDVAVPVNFIMILKKVLSHLGQVATIHSHPPRSCWQFLRTAMR